MAGVVSNDQIDQFVAITGADAATATTFLRGANGDADRAMNEYFDDPTKYVNQNRYDETAFLADRSGDYNSSSGNLLAFQIHGPETQGWGGDSVAPSRPPSRVSNNGSISSTKGIADTSAPHSMYQSQELGVMNDSHPPSQLQLGSGQQFGPANREYYDTSKWAMTLHPDTNQSVVELVPDPPPTKRRRKTQEPEPIFMKPLASGDYLPALITMMHAIPLARQALILSDNVLDDYGFDAGWWQGTPIRLSSVTHSDSGDSGFVEEDGPVAYSNSTSRNDDVVREAQRLMAFMSDSERSYGSVDALGSILQQSQVLEPRAKTLYDRFLVQWEAAVARLIPGIFDDQHLFRSTVSQQVNQGQLVEDHFWCLEVQLSDPTDAPKKTLYEALDEMIWTDSSTEQSIANVAPVLIMRAVQLNASASGLNMEVPASWYVDRYLRENFNATKAMRENVARCQSALKKLDEKKQSLSTFTHPKSGRPMDIKTMLEAAKSAFDRPKKRKLDEDGDEEEEEEPRLDGPPEARARRSSVPQPEPKPNVIAQLEAICSHIERKIERLEQERSRIQQELEQHASLFKTPADSDAQPSMHSPSRKYSLCGAAIDGRTMFVLERAPPKALIDMSDFDSASPTTDQWWRFGYSNDPVVSKQKSTEDVVVGAASEGGREVLLVYASDEAIDSRHLDGCDIPEPLKTFVARDNKGFQEEILQEEKQEAAEFAPVTSWGMEAEHEPWQEKPPGYNEGFVLDNGEGDYAEKEKRVREVKQQSDLLARAEAIEQQNGAGVEPSGQKDQERGDCEEVVGVQQEAGREGAEEGVGGEGKAGGAGKAGAVDGSSGVGDTEMVDVDLGTSAVHRDRGGVEHRELA